MFGAGTLPERMGVVVTEASPERVVGTMPVDGNTQPFGLLHGGASCVLAESLGSVAATLHAREAFGGYALGVDISATHHRSARSGRVTGVALHCAKGHSDINRLNEDLQQQSRHIAEQERRIAFLQAELAEHIYAVDGDRDSNTVEVFIARLRRKLGADAITTVRGLGYRLEA